MEIITSNNGIVFKEGTLSITKGFNSVDYNLAGEDTIIFINSGNRQTITSSKLDNFTLNGETLTTDNYNDKLKAALYQSSGGGIDAYTKSEMDELLAARNTPFNNNTLYINPHYKGSLEDGSYEHPFKTFNQDVINKAVELTTGGHRIDTFYFMPSYNTYNLYLDYSKLTVLLGINESNLNFMGIVNPNLERRFADPGLSFLATEDYSGQICKVDSREFMERIKMEIIAELGMR